MRTPHPTSLKRTQCSHVCTLEYLSLRRNTLSLKDFASRNFIRKVQIETKRNRKNPTVADSGSDFLRLPWSFFDYVCDVIFSKQTFENRSKSARLPAKINIFRIHCTRVQFLKNAHNFVKKLARYSISRRVVWAHLKGLNIKIEIFDSADTQGYSTAVGW